MGVFVGLVLESVVELLAYIGVPLVVAGGPRQLLIEDAGDRGAQVVYGPSNDDVIVDAYRHGNDQHGEADALEQRGDAPNGDRTLAGELTEGQLEEEKRNSGEEDVDGVGDEKRSPSVSEAQVRKAPNVAQADREAQAREQEFDWGVPRFAI